MNQVELVFFNAVTYKSLVAKVGRGEPDLPIDEMAGTIIYVREVMADEDWRFRGRSPFFFELRYLTDDPVRRHPARKISLARLKQNQFANL